MKKIMNSAFPHRSVETALKQIIQAEMPFGLHVEIKVTVNIIEQLTEQIKI